jgi:hypothetical protein
MALEAAKVRIIILRTFIGVVEIAGMYIGIGYPARRAVGMTSVWAQVDRFPLGTMRMPQYPAWRHRHGLGLCEDAIPHKNG